MATAARSARARTRSKLVMLLLHHAAIKVWLKTLFFHA